jgi:TFIIF-interacting CTD phosphatase-like protein
MEYKYKEGVIKDTMWGIKRPHLDEFLDFCFEHFEKVIVWSAGQRDYVHKLVDILFANTVRKPDYIWTYDDIHSDEEGYVVKPLRKLVENLDDPFINMKTIITIDDTASTFSENMENAIHIPVYKPEPTMKEIMKDERSLIQIMNFLKKKGNICNVKNVDFNEIWK